ncbi:polysaccharide deacetylase family protein [Vagococcus xieshaowenii]|uniref:Polysaccharide deacetylase family protein n=1 Tax=Vagococcus xieshaowenii TaxID=2562451 RepID=A0A4Z0DAT2_9ENTE|nr:polysaccharide deacetylase family protein [Vagococcus xieshaowenii]QCA29317.1 polysaccharide deacetylase family protein [Vagococcus xieshaowenii]TFZ41988.1 polysaccharide deacetylase family protein [Vagococcus xieshaowenii]
MRKKIITVLLAIIFIELIILSVTMLTKNNHNQKSHPQLHKNEVLVDSSQLNVNKIDESEIIKRNKQTPDTSSWIKSEDPIEFPIIAYSHVENHEMENSLHIDYFKQQLEWLEKNNYYTLTPQEAMEVFTSNKKPAEKIVWLTFDDGYYSQYKLVYPLLQQLNMQATINYLPNISGSIAFLNIYDIQEMMTNGEISIGSGTLNGNSLLDLDVTTRTRELKDSKQTLDQLLHQDTTVVAYPNNDYNDEILALAKDVGYTIGLTTNAGLASKSDGLLTLDRIQINENISTDKFAKLIEETY